jgi:predicted phage tail protein
VLDIGRAGIVNRGNVLGVVVDKAADTRDAEDNPVPLFIFDETNIVAGTFKTSYRDRSNYPTEIIVSYYDKNREYTRKTVQVRSSEDNHYQNTKDITLYCCDDAAVAKSHADYIIKQNLIKRVFNWTGDLDSMPLDIGDLVKVNENLAVIGSVTFDDEMRREFTAVEYVDARFS